VTAAEETPASDGARREEELGCSASTCQLAEDWLPRLQDEPGESVKAGRRRVRHGTWRRKVAKRGSRAVKHLHHHHGASGGLASMDDVQLLHSSRHCCSWWWWWQKSACLSRGEGADIHAPSGVHHNYRTFGLVPRP
jgi:hypothetical protein